MIEHHIITKSRYIWNPRAWQLVRERAASRYARSVVPGQVEGVRIEFAESRISLGIRISVTSTHLSGEKLLGMIYHPQKRDVALTMALTALQALYQADVTTDPFPLFGRAYRLLRNWDTLLSEAAGPRILTREQRAALHRLLATEKAGRPCQRVLAHGDLHASNVLIDLAVPRLAFLDLEMLHVGNPATDFAQLWIGFRFADPSLGRRFQKEYRERFPEAIDDLFGVAVRAEVARRCHSMIRTGQRSGNKQMERESRNLLESALAVRDWEELCRGEAGHPRS